MALLAKPNFRNIRILIVDPDNCIAQATMHCLKAMGFPLIQHVKTADEALKAIRLGAASFLITEWDIKGSNGINLVKYLRRDPESPNRSLPVIMLTGRGEMQDVISARDAGITEFVVKPFTVKTLYTRLEQMIENPRSFVLAESYIGPERRRIGKPPADTGERRIIKLTPTPTTKGAFASVGTNSTMIIAPDFSLRQALGSNAARPLSKLITPEVLENAQKAIDSLVDESIKQVCAELEEMEKACAALKQLYNANAFEALRTGALSIKARAGTFGYLMASDVARMLYLFLSVDFIPTHPKHPIVVQKYIEVMKVIFAQGIKERIGLGLQLYEELLRLTAIR